MTGKYLFYELSEQADTDIEDIFDYTEKEFGIDQAVVYVNSFEIIFEQLTNTPELGRARKEIRSGLRSIVQGGHVVFYRILKDRIRIIRILHGSRDLPNLFK